MQEQSYWEDDAVPGTSKCCWLFSHTHRVVLCGGVGGLWITGGTGKSQSKHHQRGKHRTKMTNLPYERQPAHPSLRAACHQDPNKTLLIRTIDIATASASREQACCIRAGGADGTLTAQRLFEVIYLMLGAGSNCSFPFVSHFVFCCGLSVLQYQKNIFQSSRVSDLLHLID